VHSHRGFKSHRYRHVMKAPAPNAVSGLAPSSHLRLGDLGERGAPATAPTGEPPPLLDPDLHLASGLGSQLHHGVERAPGGIGATSGDWWSRGRVGTTSRAGDRSSAWTLHVPTLHP